MTKTRTTKDGASVTVENTEKGKIAITITVGKTTTTVLVNKAQAKGVANDLMKAVAEKKPE